MNEVFLDTAYLIALLNRYDDLHAQAVEIQATLETTTLVTTELVLGELLNHFCNRGRDVDENGYLRGQAVDNCRRLLEDAQVVVEPQTHELFDLALSFYSDRPDKGYSHVDCSSMVIMKRRGILEVATADHHFTQEGFLILLHAARR